MINRRDDFEHCLICGGSEPCSHDFDEMQRTLGKRKPMWKKLNDLTDRNPGRTFAVATLVLGTAFWMSVHFSTQLPPGVGRACEAIAIIALAVSAAAYWLRKNP